MIMILKEDIQNLVFKCEKILEANEISFKRLRKEEKMLTKVLKDYVLSDDNSIVFNEIVSRHDEVVDKIVNLKIDAKSVKKVLSKIKPLLNSSEIIEDSEPEDIEIGQVE